jgi:CMP-N,N'-diacetyllegionaminic acid synthase
MKILGIVTARGGSARIHGKNIKDFLGKPLLAWTIEVGLESKVFDRFILSTDDDKILEVGKNYNIEVPFTRPLELATDTASSYEVVKHAVQFLKEKENYEPDWIILLEPSAPGRQVFHIQEVGKLIQENNNYDSIVGVSQVPPHVSHQKQLQRTSQGLVGRVGDNESLRNLVHRNQDIEPSYYINSNIYAFKVRNLFDGNNSLWGENTYAYVIEEKYAIDIDTPEDWVIGEAKMKQII